MRSSHGSRNRNSTIFMYSVRILTQTPSILVVPVDLQQTSKFRSRAAARLAPRRSPGGIHSLLARRRPQRGPHRSRGAAGLYQDEGAPTPHPLKGEKELRTLCFRTKFLNRFPLQAMRPSGAGSNVNAVGKAPVTVLAPENVGHTAPTCVGYKIA